MSPIEKMFDDVEWIAATDGPAGSGLPYATHSGVLDLLGNKIRVYRLNDGRAILNADDVRAVFGEALGGTTDAARSET